MPTVLLKQTENKKDGLHCYKTSWASITQSAITWQPLVEKYVCIPWLAGKSLLTVGGWNRSQRGFCTEAVCKHLLTDRCAWNLKKKCATNQKHRMFPFKVKNGSLPLKPNSKRHNLYLELCCTLQSFTIAYRVVGKCLQTSWRVPDKLQATVANCWQPKRWQRCFHWHTVIFFVTDFT